MDKKKIAVLCGGISGERNISLKSGRAVFNALLEKGHEVSAIDPALGENCIFDINSLDIPADATTNEELAKYSVKDFAKSIEKISNENFDVAFNLVHGKWGEDGHLTALLNIFEIPSTGANLKGSTVAMDKNMSKRLFEDAQIMTPQGFLLNPSTIDDYELFEDLRREFGKKLVIKPADQGSALGMTIIHTGNLDEINDAVKLASKYTDKILMEQYIEGRELTVSVIGDEVYPVVEIKPHEGFYDYTNKYTKGKTDYICPAELSEDMVDYVQSVADTAHRVLGLSGYSRIDIRLNEDNLPFVLEANTVPGFTELSLLPMSAKAGGLEFGDLCERIVELALES
jgi:D-alanine-D-alanine ligase